MTIVFLSEDDKPIGPPVTIPAGTVILSIKELGEEIITVDLEGEETEEETEENE